MASFLQIEKLTKSYGERMLFADVTFGVNEGDKIGIVAKNGTGKSTLFSIIAGHEAPDSGTVTFADGIRTGYLEQTPRLNGSLTVTEACREAATGADRQAWDFDDRMRQMLFQLGVTQLDSRISTLSGGQAKRVAIAAMLLAEPDFLILDEPTNHLDITLIEWLEKYLSRQRMTLLMVTHDRYFLDRVCNKVIEMDMQRIFIYHGNYDLYLRRRAERIEAMGAELARVKNTLRKEQEWMNRQPQARAGKAKYRIDAFHDLKERSRVSLTERNVSLEVKASYIGSKIFEARGVSKSFGEKKILDDFSYTFSRYEKLGIIGPNGVGKSTFIKMLQGLVQPDKGEWDVGTTVRFGYYSQEGISLDPGKKVIDAITEIAEDVVVNGDRHYTPMQFLTHFLFTPADQQKYVSTLSGGERSRLHLASVLMRSPNFLILDEPTNDLDIVTLGILEEYLRDFAGCVIVVSHDRFFLDSIVDHLFVLAGEGRVKDFPGTYTEYRQWRDEQDRQKRLATEAAPPRPAKPRKERPARMTFAERREYESLTSEIDALSAEKTALEQLFSSGASADEIAAGSERYSEISALLDEKELRWLELDEKS